MAQSKEQKELNNLINEYRGLAGKLGKLPTIREVRRFICSGDKLARIAGSLSELKAETLVKYPELEELEISVKVNPKDIEDYRIGLQKKENKKHNETAVQTANFFDYLEQFAEASYGGKIKKQYTPPKPKKIKRVHNAIWSDLHFGADISKEETSVEDFGKVEEARRFAKVVKEIANYKPQYRKDTKLIIALLGDVIENNMHDARTGAPKAEQCARAISCIYQGIAYLAQKYPEVEIHCATGNHDRDPFRHPGRAVHQKWDSYSTIIYYALKQALKNVKNVKFFIPKCPMGSYEVFGRKIAYTHADGTINVGNPYKSLNVASIEHQVNKINASLKDSDEYAAILYGHTHIAHTVYLSNGTVLIGNAGLPPTDSFGVSLGSFETNNGQWIFESVEGFPVGDMRMIRVKPEDSKNVELDKIIEPWKGFND